MDAPPLPELIQKCCAGDVAARGQFYQRFEPLVRRVATITLTRSGSAAHPATEARDVAHEVFAKLFDDECRRLQTVKHSSAINAWLTSVTRNQAYSYVRSNYKHDALAEDPASYGRPIALADSDHFFERREDIARLRTVVEGMEATDRLILKLYYEHGLKYSEITDMLSMNINTVASRIKRAKERLRAAFEEST